MDPPEANYGQLFMAKGYAALDRLVTLVISLDTDEASKHFLLRDFLETVNSGEAQVRKL